MRGSDGRGREAVWRDEGDIGEAEVRTVDQGFQE